MNRENGKAGGMGRPILFVTIVSALSLAGCSALSDRSIKPEPVSFDHADEIIRGQGFMVLADRRVFAVMAFLNAAGFDEEVAGRQMHPVRARMREMVSANLTAHPKKLEAWRRYYETRRLGTFCYQDFALSLSAEYPFRRIRPDADLGYAFTAERLREFPEILNDFWVTAQLDEVWDDVKDDYLVELRKYDFQKMEQGMAFLWKYLRMERRDTFTIVNVPNLLDRHYHAIGARYENYYYSVEGPGAIGYGLNTHEYLHSIVNGLMQSNYGQQKGKLLKYYKAGRSGELSKSYQHPVTFAYECLVHAIDYRLRVLRTDDAAAREAAEKTVASLSKGGLILTQPFYRLLPEYELSGRAFNQFLPTLLQHLPEYK